MKCLLCDRVIDSNDDPIKCPNCGYTNYNHEIELYAQISPIVNEAATVLVDHIDNIIIKGLLK